MTRRDFSKPAARDRMHRRGTESVAGRSTPPVGMRPSGRERSSAPAPAQETRTLAVVDKFWRDRSGRAVVVRLIEFNGHALIDLRTFYTADDGTLKPAKGFACNVRLLPRLARSIEKAVAKGRELNLISDKGGE